MSETALPYGANLPKKDIRPDVLDRVKEMVSNTEVGNLIRSNEPNDLRKLYDHLSAPAQLLLQARFHGEKGAREALTQLAYQDRVMLYKAVSMDDFKTPRFLQITLNNGEKLVASIVDIPNVPAGTDLREPATVKKDEAVNVEPARSERVRQRGVRGFRDLGTRLQNIFTMGSPVPDMAPAYAAAGAPDIAPAYNPGAAIIENSGDFGWTTVENTVDIPTTIENTDRKRWGSRFDGLLNRVKDMAAKLGRLEAKDLLQWIKDNPELAQSLAISAAVALASAGLGGLSVGGVALGGTLSVAIREAIGRRQVAAKGEQISAFQKIFDRLTSNRNTALPEYDFYGYESFTVNGPPSDEFALNNGDYPPVVFAEAGGGISAPTTPEDVTPEQQAKWRGRLGKVLRVSGEFLTAPEKALSLGLTGMHNSARRLERTFKQERSNGDTTADRLFDTITSRRHDAGATSWDAVEDVALDAEQVLKDLRKLDLVGNNISQTMLERLNPGVQAYDRTIVSGEALKRSLQEYVHLAQNESFRRDLDAVYQEAMRSGDAAVYRVIDKLRSALDALASKQSYIESKTRMAKNYRNRTMMAQVGSTLAKSAFAALIRGNINGLGAEGPTTDTRPGSQPLGPEVTPEPAATPMADLVQPEATPQVPPQEQPLVLEPEPVAPSPRAETMPLRPKVDTMPIVDQAAEVLGSHPDVEWMANSDAWHNLLELAKVSDVEPGTEMGVVNLFKNALKLDGGGNLVPNGLPLDEAMFNGIRDANVMPTFSDIIAELDQLKLRPGFNQLLQNNPDLNAIWLVGRGGVDNNATHLQLVKDLIAQPDRANTVLSTLKTAAPTV